MNFLELLLISVALILDTAILCITNGMLYKKITSLQYFMMPIIFGLTQVSMMFIGYFIGSLIQYDFYEYSGLIIGIIFAFLGVKKIKSGLTDKSCTYIKQQENLSYKMLGLQAILSSIDVLSVSFSFSHMNVNILEFGIIVTSLTICLCYIALNIGIKNGESLGNKAELLGGVILFLLGVKSFL